MNYQNAKDILPQKLLDEIRKYYKEGMLYIPQSNKQVNSSFRMELLKRNQMILANYKNGKSITELADLFHLSVDSVKKIVYSRANSKLLDYQESLVSALSFDQKGLLEEWLHSHFLIFEDNETYSSKLLGSDYLVFGIVKLPLRLISANESGKLYTKDCPLIIEYRDNQFTCISGSNKLKSLKENKVNSYQSIIILKKDKDENDFMHHYGKHLVYMKRT